MKSCRHIAGIALNRCLVWSLAVLVGLVAGVPITLSAQSSPPVQGTIALEGTMKKVYRAANIVIVTTMDGMEHVYHFTKDLFVYGGKGAGVDALEGLREGSPVVVHYRVAGAQESATEIDRIGDEGLKITEATVTRIDRARKQIMIRFDNGTTETLRLTDRAAAEAGTDVAATGETKIIVYYADEKRSKVAHFFKKAS
jgi:hypothetical protein